VIFQAAATRFLAAPDSDQQNGNQGETVKGAKENKIDWN